MHASPELQNLIVVYAAYVVASASPGPSNMAIMATAMHRGRASALAFAGGVMTGSLFWSSLAATGVSALLAAFAQAMIALKIAGGLYLLWLAWKSARSALAGQASQATLQRETPTLRALYRRGLMLHLTNPKSILSWIAIMSIGLGENAHAATVFAIMGGCAILGATIFFGYALIFSTAPMVRLYNRARRAIEATVAMVFAFAGVQLLLSRV